MPEPILAGRQEKGAVAPFLLERMIRELYVNRFSRHIVQQIPTWQQVFLDADPHTKRVLVDKLVERIVIKEEQITIWFRIRLDEFIDCHGKNACLNTVVK